MRRPAGGKKADNFEKVMAVNPEKPMKSSSAENQNSLDNPPFL